MMISAPEEVRVRFVCTCAARDGRTDPLFSSVGSVSDALTDDRGTANQFALLRAVLVSARWLPRTEVVERSPTRRRMDIGCEKGDEKWVCGPKNVIPGMGDALFWDSI